MAIPQQQSPHTYWPSKHPRRDSPSIFVQGFWVYLTIKQKGGGKTNTTISLAPLSSSGMASPPEDQYKEVSPDLLKQLQQPKSYASFVKRQVISLNSHMVRHLGDRLFKPVKLHPEYLYIKKKKPLSLPFSKNPPSTSLPPLQPLFHGH